MLFFFFQQQILSNYKDTIGFRQNSLSRIQKINYRSFSKMCTKRTPQNKNRQKSIYKRNLFSLHWSKLSNGGFPGIA